MCPLYNFPTQKITRSKIKMKNELSFMIYNPKLSQIRILFSTKLDYPSLMQLQGFFLVETFLYFLKFLLETYSCIIFKTEKTFLKIKVKGYSN